MQNTTASANHLTAENVLINLCSADSASMRVVLTGLQQMQQDFYSDYTHGGFNVGDLAQVQQMGSLIAALQECLKQVCAE